MIKKTVYIAKDGAEFDEEEKCFEYELKNELDNIGANIHVWDNLFQPIKNFFKNQTFIDDISYILLNTDEEALIFQEWADHYSFITPWENGINITETPHAGAFYYDYDNDGWREINSELEKLNNIYKLFFNTEINW